MSTESQEENKKRLNDKFFKILSELQNIENTLNSGMKIDFLYSSKTNFESFEKDISTNIFKLKEIIQKEIIK